MRNLFDQYTQPENRLTHALAVCLSEDRRLLRRFVKWTTGDTAPAGLKVVEQQLPGEPVVNEDEAERRGLPDIWVYNDGGWCLLIENKIADTVRTDQLRRHYRTAERRGFSTIYVLAVDVVEPKSRLPDFAAFRRWPELYEWFGRRAATSEWARRLIDYMAVAETKLPFEGYLKEGTLTKFSGFPFNADNPYNYLEAKRVLKLALDQLRGDKSLTKAAGIDPKLPGRGAITGKEGVGVWDCLRLRRSKDEPDFTKYPHFTLSIRRDDVYALVTIPNSIKSEFRRNLFSGGEEAFMELFATINKNLNKVVRKSPGAIPWVELMQRHYRSQRSQPSTDARLAFDLRTAFGPNENRVKYQPLWMEAAIESLRKKRANTQLAVGVLFPYSSCPKAGRPEILSDIANTWIGCKPLIDLALNR